MDHEFAWYIPFKKRIATDKIYIGAWHGFFVDKMTGEHFQPGSGFTLEKWLIGFQMGLRYEKYDLIISKINDLDFTIGLLKKLNFSYFIEDIKYGATWKIPQTFSDAMLLQRLERIPAVFYNQRLTSCIDIFEEIVESNAFEFKLVPNQSETNDIGENHTHGID